MMGLVKETTGHVSARIPGTDEMFVRGRGDDESGLLFTTEQEILEVDFDGTMAGPQGSLRPPNELPIHGEIYKTRPQVHSVVHAHPPAVLLCGIAGIELRPIFGGYDPSAMRLAVNGIPVFPRSLTLHRPEDVHPMLEVMGTSDVCIMKGHGITVTGATIEEATVRAIKLEALARVTWEADRHGRVPDISQEDLAMFAQRGRKQGHAGPVWRYYVALLERRDLLPDAAPPATRVPGPTSSPL